MFPVVARLGPLTLTTYTLLIDAAIVAGLAWLYRRAPRPQAGQWLNAGLAATAGGLAGARLLYVLANFGYYGGHLAEILQVWRGGLAWPGAALGGLAGAWMYCSRRRLPVWPLVEALALPVTWLAAAGWAGCLAAGCAYGYEVSPGQLPAWLIWNAPDLYGLIVPRWPTALLGLTYSLLALWLVWSSAERRWPEGARGLYALSLTALGAFFLDFTRGDPMPLLAGYRLDVIGSALVLLAASLAWAWRLARPAAPFPVESAS